MQINRSSHSEQLFFWFAFILSHMDLCTCIMGLSLALLRIFVGYCFKYHTCNELKLNNLPTVWYCSGCAVENELAGVNKTMEIVDKAGCIFLSVNKS